MDTRKQLTRLLGALSLIVLAACSGGSSNRAPVIPPVVPPATEAVSSLGVISALGSATVNGVQYDTGATTVTTNGVLASFSDLEIGQIVSLEGTIEVNGPRGTAARIDYEATVIGPVESIDATLGQLVVMGQAVGTDSDTIFDPSIDPSTLAGLTVGLNAEISGFLNAGGEFIATRIEPNTLSAGVQLIGSVAGLDLANMLFNVNRQIVDYSSATLIDVPGGAPAEDTFVLMRGSLANGILIVDELLSPYDTDGGTVGERAQAQGLITRFVSPTDFDLNGFPIITDATTAFVNGTIGDLLANAEITIDGEIAAGGGSILANQIAFGRLVNPTTTLTFNLDNFTRISLSGVYQVSVTQSPDFLVEVTIDTDQVSRVDVTQAGATLNFDLIPQSGNDNIQTIEAVVTLPLLETISTDGVIYVVLNDFDQSQLTANVDGVSRLQSDSLVIGNLTANVTGVSQLDFADIRPLGSANIIVGGVSTATLNMNIGSSLTGSVTGPSSLFYYGTNVVVNVTTEPASILTRLGATRP